MEEHDVALDEMVDGQGGIRPHWRPLIGAISALGPGGLENCARRLDRAFEEEGLGSVLPGAGSAGGTCDPMPLIVQAAEFRRLSTALAQRARLLSLILADIYGPQRLLTEGKLPPALVFANPAFLRASRFLTPTPLLHLYAADMVRWPDGAWRVLTDRAAHPSGIGYARENRRLLARVLPEAFQPMQVRQLRPFFDVWQDALQHLSPGGRPDPVVALLTPGTGQAQWFEHMYLARELSCALVEGGDLTVRNGAVFLKTLRGLQQVDVLLRAVDGRRIDPLELETGSGGIGVPGLLDAVRTGSVTIANDPGAGVLEAPGLAPFLPALCRELLGEELLTCGPPALWLGAAGATAQVMAEPERWRLRPALDGLAPAVNLTSLPRAERDSLMRSVAARPWEWVAIGHAPSSVAPCVRDGKLEPQPILLRMFLISDGATWLTLPGGLARVLETDDGTATSLPRTGLAKDVWVLAEERSNLVGPAARRLAPVELRRTSGDLPSRVADNLFWLGRYVERLERGARLVRAAVARALRGSALLPRETKDLAVLTRCLVDSGLIPREVTQGRALAEALLGTVRAGGAITGMFENVAALVERVRDRLTGDMYATFTQMMRTARTDAGASGRSLDSLAHAMVSIGRFAAAFAGMAAENMVRGGGWLFLEMGRRLERAYDVASELACALDQPPSHIESGLLMALELCDSAITYRNRYLNVLQPAPVLDLVLADPGNPRGLAFQMTAMHGLLDELASGTGTDAPEGLAPSVAGLLVSIEVMVEGVHSELDQSAAAAALAPQLRMLASDLGALSDRITRRYFALLPAVQTLGPVPEDHALTGAA